MSLLTICTNACNDLGVGVPTSIIGSTDPAATRVLQMARRAGLSLAAANNWASMVVEHTFTADGSSDYALPADYRSMVDNTMWDRTTYWSMRGAMSPQQWQMYKSSVIGRASIQPRWRIRVPTGAAAGTPVVFSIDPPIGAADTSTQFVFEYASNNWCRSATTYQANELIPVAAGSGYAIGDLFSIVGGTSTATALGLVTSLTSGGTGIATAEVSVPGNYTVEPSSPAASTATTGAGAGATFLVNTTTFEGVGQVDWAADTDTGIISEDLIEMGVIWRLARRLGFSYDEEKEEYQRELDTAIARDGGTAVIDLAPGYDLPLISPWWSIPETGFGR